MREYLTETCPAPEILGITKTAEELVSELAAEMGGVTEVHEIMAGNGFGAVAFRVTCDPAPGFPGGEYLYSFTEDGDMIAEVGADEGHTLASLLRDARNHIIECEVDRHLSGWEDRY